MPQPAPVALVGDLLATQAKVHGAAAMLVDASVRDVEELVELGLPIWARYVRVRGADEGDASASSTCPVEVGGATIRPGDIVVLDADGAAVVEHERVAEVLDAARWRARRHERGQARASSQAGALSYDLDGLRAIVEEARDRAAARDRPHQPRRAADPEARGEPALLRRRPGDGGRGARGRSRSSCAAGATTSATASSSPSPTPRASAHWRCAPGARRRSSGGSAADRGGRARARAGATATRPRARLSLHRPRRPRRSSCSTRSSATRRRRSCARR